MKLAHIQHELYNRPLLLEKRSWNSIHRLVQAKIKGELNPIDPSELEEEDYEDYNVVDGVAFVSINGPIGRKLSFIEKACTGATDINDIQFNLQRALNNETVETICLLIDSPGGTIDSVVETAEMVKEINDNYKPVVSVCDGMMCSAAYFIGSAASSIISVGVTAEVGSIGVFCMALDSSRKLENEGIDPVLVKSQGSKYKAELMPGMPISEEAKKNLQQEVDYIYDLFTKHVKSARPQIKEEALNGRSFMSERAEELGLIDGYVKSINQIFEII